MKITYDPVSNALYVAFADQAPAGGVRTEVQPNGLNIDYAPDGTLYGIEILDARETLGTEAPLNHVNFQILGAPLTHISALAAEQVRYTQPTP
jgi:uncharacterized protein YuzE